MRIGTLFSGIGSPEQAAKRVFKDDFELVFACEWDKYARESFKANYEIEDNHFHKDINDMDGTQYQGKVDIIVGGSPCQGFSIAGLRSGVDGHRGQLIWQYFRIIKEIMPKYFIYENVKGMISDKNGKTLNDFLAVFRSIGYSCHYEVLNTKDYGVPQNRERIFIVGFLESNEYYRFQFAPKVKLEKRLKDILEDDVDEKYYLSHQFISGMLKHKERHKSKGNGFAFEPKEAKDIDKANCLSCGYGTRVTDTYIKELQLIQKENYKIRKLTPRECFRLQDFPDTFKFIVSNTQLYKQAGNSISVNVIEMIFRQLQKAINGKDLNSLF